jgi:hypothetical protein
MLENHSRLSGTSATHAKPDMEKAILCMGQNEM